MKRSTLIIAAITFGTLLFSYNNCTNATFSNRSSYGGIAGNPIAPTSNELLFAVCGVITKCNSSLTVSACQSGVLGAGSIAPTLGLSQSSYPIYSSILQAEQTGSLVGNTNATSSCYSTISTLTCSDPTVVGAYDPAAANPFANVAQIIPARPTAQCQSVFSTITGWNFVDGGGANGINFSTSKNAERPMLTSFNSKLYGTWRETGGPTGQMQVRVRIYNGNDAAPSWTSVDGGGTGGINHSTSNNVYEPKLIVLNSKLYNVWLELNAGGSGIKQLRASVYNGNDAAPSWTSVDGAGANGLNFDPTKNAYSPHMAVLNSKLYVTWNEQQTSGTSGQIRVLVYNGNDSAPAWTVVDGGSASGINFSNPIGAEEPEIVFFNSKLYVSWEEFNSGQGGNQEMRVKVYNGNDVAPGWSSVDGGGVNGLNFNPTMKTWNSQMTSFSSKLYITWTEFNASGVPQVRVRVYNGNDSVPSWTFVDGNGPNGLNRDVTQPEDFPQIYSFAGQLYLTWAESSGSAKLIHVDVYNGNDSSPAWISADGGGINRNPAQVADSPQMEIFNSKVYLIWSEVNGAIENIRSAVAH